jgi:D-alanyl-lipoteichoic acid acyltransferase DltB (MBOAT superfamily)
LRLFVSDTYEKVLLRLNPTTHRWLLRYVYLPLGGNQNRVRNTLLSYGLSGLWHEYLLVAASMTLTGLWFAYFAVNGVIVSLEPFAGSVRGALLSGFAPASIAHRTLSRAVQLLNFLLNVLVAHLMFRGLELVVEFH